MKPCGISGDNTSTRRHGRLEADTREAAERRRRRVALSCSLGQNLATDVFPSINRRDVKNPALKFNLYIDSHADAREVRVIYYNNRFSDGLKNGRNETRITGFGGSESALLDPDSTGALTVFAFPTGQGDPAERHVSVCRHETDEDVVEDRVGPVEPGKFFIQPVGGTAQGILFPIEPLPPWRSLQSG
jgi:hypothetical protein